MKVIEFKEQTIIIAKDQPEYLPLPAYQFNDFDGRIAFRWKMTWKERLTVLFTGTLWHQVFTYGRSLQPQMLGTIKPIMNPHNQTSNKSN